MTGRQSLEALEILGNVPGYLAILADDAVLSDSSDEDEFQSSDNGGFGRAATVLSLMTRKFTSNSDLKLDRLVVLVANQ